MNLIDKIRLFFEKHISYEDVTGLNSSKKRLQVLGIFIIECYKSIMRHQTLTAASALAFKSIVAIVPLIFIGIAVASMLGTSEHENYVNSFIVSIEAKIPDVPELKPMLDLIRGFADKAREIVGLSFIVLFYVAYTLLANIEKAFNSIWQIDRKRIWINRVVAYLAAIIIIPIMMSFSVYLNSQVEVVTIKMANSIESTKKEAYEMILSHLPIDSSDDGDTSGGDEPLDNEVMSGQRQSFLVKVVLGGLSLALTSFAVMLLIIFMPFTRVKIIPALIGGVFSGVILELMKFGFSLYVNYAGTNLTRLYGSTLLVFPLFLLWVWMVWTVILLGAEIAFNIQNYYDLVATSHFRRKGYSYNLYLATSIMCYVCTEFYTGEVAVGIIDKLARRFMAPPVLIRKLVLILLDNNLLREVKAEGDAYSPGRDIAHINVLDVFNAINKTEFDSPAGVESRTHDEIKNMLFAAHKDVSIRFGQVTFLDLARSEVVEDE